MGNSDGLRANVAKAAATLADPLLRDRLNLAVAIVVSSLATIAAAAVIGVIIYAARH